MGGGYEFKSSHSGPRPPDHEIMTITVWRRLNLPYLILGDLASDLQRAAHPPAPQHLYPDHRVIREAPTVPPDGNYVWGVFLHDCVPGVPHVCTPTRRLVRWNRRVLRLHSGRIIDPRRGYPRQLRPCLRRTLPQRATGVATRKHVALLCVPILLHIPPKTPAQASMATHCAAHASSPAACPAQPQPPCHCPRSPHYQLQHHLHDLT